MIVEPDHSTGADRDGAADAAEDALLDLRHKRLIHSFQRDGASFQVLVGRGTIDVPTMDAGDVLRLVHDLQRDKIVIVGKGHPAGHRTTRYHLSDGRFTDRHDGPHGRYLPEYPYTVFVPGGHRGGYAAEDFAARTQREALALAGLARVRGRCTVCRSHRPLHVQRWRPDPAIPCPGCGAGADAAVVLHCRSCQQPICPNTAPAQWVFDPAWLHTDTGHAYCDLPGHNHTVSTDAQARPV